MPSSSSSSASSSILTHFLYFAVAAGRGGDAGVGVGLLTALVLAHMPVGQPSLRQASALAARTALLGAPMMVLLFVLFPRIGPLWGVPQDGSSTHRPVEHACAWARCAEIAQDDSVALRVRFDGTPPPPGRCTSAARCWRASTASSGGRCRTGVRAAAWRRTPTCASAARAVRYEMTLEPQRLAALPLLEATRRAPPTSRATVCRARDDLQWVADRPVLRAAALQRRDAHRDFRHGPTRRPVEPARSTCELPPGCNPRTLAWAAALRARPAPCADADARSLAQAVLTHIRSGGYTYTLRAAATTAATRSTSSGSTAGKASASTSPPPSSS